jgi:hypothetical protein
MNPDAIRPINASPIPPPTVAYCAYFPPASTIDCGKYLRSIAPPAAEIAARIRLTRGNVRSHLPSTAPPAGIAGTGSGKRNPFVLNAPSKRICRQSKIYQGGANVIT